MDVEGADTAFRVMVVGVVVCVDEIVQVCVVVSAVARVTVEDAILND